MNRLRAVVASFGLLASLTAQQGVPLDATATIPIHGVAGDETGEFGLWASGRGYKARLDGGFCFYPALGAAYEEHLPLGWTTESVRLGGEELVSGTREEGAAGETRYEYRWSGLVEAYDLRAEGAEQTFEIPQAPKDPGPLVVTGHVATPLLADLVEGIHGALEFRGPSGERILEYGAATAIDARGRSFKMTTTYDGARIRLGLDADSVALATFPLVVDPVLSTHFTWQVGMVAIAGSLLYPTGASVTRPIAIAFTRIATATDHDAATVYCTEHFATTFFAFVDSSTRYSSEKIAIGTESGTQLSYIGTKYLTAVERRYPSGVRTELHLYGSENHLSTLNGGYSYVLQPAPGVLYRNPAVGGGFTTGFVIVYDRTIGSSHAVGASRIPPLSNFLRATALADLATTTAEVQPTVARINGTGTWIAAWATEDGSAIRGRRIHGDGSVGNATATLVQSSAAIFSQPRIASDWEADDEYLLTYSSVPTRFGVRALVARPFNWRGDSTPPIPGPTRSLGFGDFYDNGSVSSIGDGVWYATFTERTVSQQTTRAVRLGYRAGVVTSVELHTAADRPYGLVAAPSVDSVNRRLYFACAYATPDAATHPLLGTEQLLPSSTFYHTYRGTSCASVEDERWEAALTGRRNFDLILFRPGQVALGAVAVGVSWSTIPLDPIGMTGCTLMNPFVDVLPATDNRVSFPIPDSPPFTGRLITQWIYTEPGANALGLVTNRIVQHTVQ